MQTYRWICTTLVLRTVFQADHIRISSHGKLSSHSVLLPPGQKHQWDKIIIPVAQGRKMQFYFFLLLGE
jgi:hypothetical protein